MACSPLGLTCSQQCAAWSTLSRLPAPCRPLCHHRRVEHGGDGGQEDFAGFRERQPADSPRHIAWKASARHPEGPLLIKQFAGGSQVELILDWQQTEPSLSHETRIGILTGWVVAAEESGMNYGLCLPNLELAPDGGEPHCQRCLEALALFQP